MSRQPDTSLDMRHIRTREESLLVAALRDDTGRVGRLLGEMLPGERRAVARATDLIRAAIDDAAPVHAVTAPASLTLVDTTTSSLGDIHHGGCAQCDAVGTLTLVRTGAVSMRWVCGQCARAHQHASTTRATDDGRAARHVAGRR